VPLSPKKSDIASLALIADGKPVEVPAFDLSRLVAMGLVEKRDAGGIHLTEKGVELLEKNRS
jgi:hypothetical protein